MVDTLKGVLSVANGTLSTLKVTRFNLAKAAKRHPFTLHSRSGILCDISASA